MISHRRELDELPALCPDRDDYRYLVATGLLVPAVTITAQLVADGSVVLFGIDIEAGVAIDVADFDEVVAVVPGTNGSSRTPWPKLSEPRVSR